MPEPLSRASLSAKPCPVCADDGWIDVNDEETGGVVGARECPRLDESGHAAFNATGLLDGRRGALPGEDPFPYG